MPPRVSTWRGTLMVRTGSRPILRCQLIAKPMLYFVVAYSAQRNSVTNCSMTTALRARLQALRRLAERPGTAAEGIAAELAIERILRRLGDDAERLVEKEPPYQPRQPKRTGRQQQRMQKDALAVGDVIDAIGSEGVFRYCKCCNSRFEIINGGDLTPGLLRCCRCTRSRRLEQHHFQPGGRWRMS
jgi:hypothetical protein